MPESALLDECPWLAKTEDERRYVRRRIAQKVSEFERALEEREWDELAAAAKTFNQIPETVRPPAFRTENTHVRRKQKT